jgi:hypothetical protein
MHTNVSGIGNLKSISGSYRGLCPLKNPKADLIPEVLAKTLPTVRVLRMLVIDLANAEGARTRPWMVFVSGSKYRYARSRATM